MSELFQIEKGIPIPKYKETKETPSRYPLSKMEVGDSFKIPCLNQDRKTLQTNMETLAFRWTGRNGLSWRFVARSVDFGVRVWRVK